MNFAVHLHPEPCGRAETMGGPDALSKVELIITFAVAVGIGFGVGYAVRERKSRMRRRRYYQGDSTGS
jgi:hypothetical protein